MKSVPRVTLTPRKQVRGRGAPHEVVGIERLAAELDAVRRGHAGEFNERRGLGMTGMTDDTMQ